MKAIDYTSVCVSFFGWHWRWNWRKVKRFSPLWWINDERRDMAYHHLFVAWPRPWMRIQDFYRKFVIFLLRHVFEAKLFRIHHMQHYHTLCSRIITIYSILSGRMEKHCIWFYAGIHWTVYDNNEISSTN